MKKLLIALLIATLCITVVACAGDPVDTTPNTPADNSDVVNTDDSDSTPADSTPTDSTPADSTPTDSTPPEDSGTQNPDKSDVEVEIVGAFGELQKGNDWVVGNGESGIEVPLS